MALSLATLEIAVATLARDAAAVRRAEPYGPTTDRVRNIKGVAGKGL
jgi:hypothetical protein